jgi:two-component system, OmpR family, response regulator ArlR
MAKLLVVEDDQFLRELYVDTLKGEGYDVDFAEDGEIALQKIKQGGWDLVLLDIILPKMSGLDIAKQLAATAPSNLPPIVFMTNLDKDEEIKQALQLGKGYIIKSQITPGDLTNEVKKYLPQQPQNTPSTS